MPDTEIPADLVRRAAEKLRTLAEDAPKSASGRWYVRTPQGEYPQTVYDNASAILVAETFEGPQHPQSTAPFIAAMDPTVALLIADGWLHVADDMGDYEAFECSVAQGISSEDHGYRADWTATFRAARAFLRET